jgi:hypothetical protein
VVIGLGAYPQPANINRINQAAMMPCRPSLGDCSGNLGSEGFRCTNQSNANMVGIRIGFTGYGGWNCWACRVPGALLPSISHLSWLCSMWVESASTDLLVRPWHVQQSPPWQHCENRAAGGCFRVACGYVGRGRPLSEEYRATALLQLAWHYSLGCLTVEYKGR